jgi:hypothetical protein
MPGCDASDGSVAPAGAVIVMRACRGSLRELVLMSTGAYRQVIPTPPGGDGYGREQPDDRESR